MKRLVYASHNNSNNRIYYNLFSAESVNPQEINLTKTEENFSLVKDGNLCHGEEEQRDVQQPIDDADITAEIIIPPGGKTFIVIICTAV